MRDLVYFVAVSLDGKIAAPDGDYSAFPVEGDHITWIVQEYTDTLPAPALQAMGLEADRSRFSTVLMGWNTYAVGLPHGVTEPYSHLEQVVVTQRHRDEVPAGIRIIGADPAADVQQLKQEPGTDIWLCGGGTLASALADQIDRLVLKVNPVVLGDGIPLFAHTPRGMDLRLVDTTRFTSGVLVNEYVRR